MADCSRNPDASGPPDADPSGLIDRLVPENANRFFDAAREVAEELRDFVKRLNRAADTFGERH